MNKKMLTSVFALIFVMMLSLSLGAKNGMFPDAAAAEISWEMDDSGILTVRCSGAMPDYSENNQPWYEKRNDIKKVVFQKGIVRIGNYAFYDCDYIETIQLPDGLKEIGTFAFAYCDRLKTLDIPDSVDILGYASFFACPQLESVKLGNGVKELPCGPGARYFNYNEGNGDYYPGFFEGCTGLKKIEFGTGIMTIGKDCFIGTALKKVYLSDNITSFDTSAFDMSKAYFICNINTETSDTLDKLGIPYINYEVVELSSVGDTNNDGTITVSDARTALRIAIKLDSSKSGTAVFFCADVNCDNKVDVSDARMILRVAIKLEDVAVLDV